MVDKMKDKTMMKKLEDLEDAEMIILDDGEWKPLDTGSEDVLPVYSVTNSRRKESQMRNRQNTKHKTTIRKKKRRRRQRVKIRRGYGDKVQSVYIAY